MSAKSARPMYLLPERASRTAREVVIEALGDDDPYLVSAGMVLLAALRVGPVNRRIRYLTEIPVGRLERMSYYLRGDGIWDHRCRWIDYIWLDEPDPQLQTIGFICDVLVASGMAEKTEGMYRLRSDKQRATPGRELRDFVL